MWNLWLDVRYAARALRKTLGTTVFAVLTLSLGIGVNTANFSWADASLWRPLPLPQAEQLVAVVQRSPDKGATLGPVPTGWDPVTPAGFLDWRQQQDVFDTLVAYKYAGANLADAGAEPQRILGAVVTADFFHVLRVKPAKGRVFLPEEDQEGKDAVVVLSHGLWQQRYGGDPNIVGRTIRVNGQTRTVVGTMPGEFDFPIGAEMWMPLSLTLDEQHSRTSHELIGIARMRPGISGAAAEARMRVVQQRLARLHPQTDRGWDARVIPVRELIVPEEAARFTRMLVVGMGFVLLIACVNVANLQLARAAGRVREIAVRTALGASRSRIVWQFLCETLITSLLGAGFALLLTHWTRDALLLAIPPEMARYILGTRYVPVDFRVFAFTVGITLVAGVVSGIVPALQYSRPNVSEALKDGGWGALASRQRHRLSSLLVVSEVALTIVLLIGAGLMVRVAQWVGADPDNIHPNRLLVLRLNLNRSEFADDKRKVRFQEDAVARLTALPGVRSVAAVSIVPHTWEGAGSPFVIEGKPPLDAAEQKFCLLESVSPAYFRTMNIPLREARELSDQDGPEAPRAAVIGEAMARRYWPGENPLGRRISLGEPGPAHPWIRIVGVVGDIRQHLMERAAQPVLYLPYPQAPTPTLDFVLRTDAEPADSHGLAGTARAELQKLAADQTPYDVRTMRKLIDTWEAFGFRFSATLMTVFGGLALLLAAIGVYGVLSRAVRDQTRELGLRLALGADSFTVLMGVMKWGLKVVSLGLIIGLVMALLLVRAVSSMLYGVDPIDVVSFVVFPAILVVVAGFACYLPARRAARIDPMMALRDE